MKVISKQSNKEHILMTKLHLLKGYTTLNLKTQNKHKSSEPPEKLKTSPQLTRFPHRRQHTYSVNGVFAATVFTQHAS